MKTTVLSLLVLILVLVPVAGGLDAGEDGSLLQKLDAECRSLTSLADAATVEIRITGSVWGLRVLPDPRQPASAIPFVYYLLDRQNSAVSVARATPSARITGVLVGTPPVVVTSAGAVGRASEIAVHLADGTVATAKLVASDPDLGVAVFALPESVSKGRQGLSLDRSPSIERGRLVLVTGAGKSQDLGPLGLAIVRGGSPLDGGFRVDGLTDGPWPGQPALAVNGRLLGISAGSAAAPTTHQALSRTLPKLEVMDRTVQLEGKLAVLARPVQLVGTDLRATPQGVKPKEPAKKGQAGKPAKKPAKKTPPAWGTPSRYTYYSPNAVTAPAPRRPAVSFIPGSVIGRVLDDLAAHGRIRHSYLGVVLGQTRGKGESRGVEIRSVLEDSPAAKAGLRAGYLVRTVDGEEVLDPGRLGRALIHRRPGDTIRIRVAGSTAEFVVMLGDRDTAQRRLVTPEDLGLSCLDLGPELTRFLGLPEGTRGVVVRNVQPGSAAAAAGIARGQVIVGGGGEPIADLEELRAAVAVAKDTVVLDLRAGTKTVARSVRITPRKVGSGTR